MSWIAIISPVSFSRAHSGVHPKLATATPATTAAFTHLMTFPPPLTTLSGAFRFMPSALDDAGRDEQQQLVVGVGDEAIAEQRAQDRQAGQERRASLRGLLVRLVDAADDRRRPVPYQHLGLRGLGVDRGDAVHQVREVGRV